MSETRNQERPRQATEQKQRALHIVRKRRQSKSTDTGVKVEQRKAWPHCFRVGQWNVYWSRSKTRDGWKLELFCKRAPLSDRELDRRRRIFQR